MTNPPDFTALIRPGDHIFWGQACGEPRTLTETLVAQRTSLGPLTCFVGASFSDTLRPEHADTIRFISNGAIGTTRRLAQAGVLDLIPCHVAQIGPYISQRILRCDVALVQVSPAGPDGRHSFGVIADYLRQAVTAARLVIAEINDQFPWTHGDPGLAPGEIHHAIHTSRPVVELPQAAIADTDRAIAHHVAAYIEDGATLQIGIGATPEAVLQLLADRRDLGIHSGMIGDGVLDLIERGVVTNAQKSRDKGITVTGALIGTKRLYDHAHLNKSIELRDSATTTNPAILAGIEKLVTLNSALEVDLSGQVNAESTGGAYIGAIGGQADFVRAGHRAPGGHAIIALPATARGGKLSRIVAKLDGPVTTPRCDVDVVVTEFGAAELRGQGLAERARRLIAIAHPAFAEALRRGLPA